MFPRGVRATLMTLAVAALLAPASSIAAQQTGVIRGRVTEAGSQRTNPTSASVVALTASAVNGGAINSTNVANIGRIGGSLRDY